MGTQFPIGGSKILKIDNGVLGEEYYYDFGFMELCLLKSYLKCKFITADNLRFISNMDEKQLNNHESSDN